MPIHNFPYPATEKISSQELLTKLGALISSEVSVPSKLAAALQNDGKKVPDPINVPALFDTGASKTAVDKDILDKLGIPTVGQTSISTPSGTHPQALYPVKLEFPGSPIPAIEFNSVVSCNLKGFDAAILIGRDIICQCIFILNGPAGHYSISF